MTADTPNPTREACGEVPMPERIERARPRHRGSLPVGIDPDVLTALYAAYDRDRAPAPTREAECARALRDASSVVHYALEALLHAPSHAARDKAIDLLSPLRDRLQSALSASPPPSGDGDGDGDEVKRLRQEIEEALQMTEGCSTLKDLAASFIEASATRAMAMKATETFYASQKQNWEWNDREADRAWSAHCRAIAKLREHLGSPSATPSSAEYKRGLEDAAKYVGARGEGMLAHGIRALLPSPPSRATEPPR